MNEQEQEPGLLRTSEREPAAVGRYEASRRPAIWNGWPTPALSSKAEERENYFFGSGLPGAAACGLAPGYYLSSFQDFEVSRSARSAAALPPPEKYQPSLRDWGLLASIPSLEKAGLCSVVPPGHKSAKDAGERRTALPMCYVLLTW